MAIDAQVPGPSIPLLFNNGVSVDEDAIERAIDNNARNIRVSRDQLNREKTLRQKLSVSSSSVSGPQSQYRFPPEPVPFSSAASSSTSTPTTIVSAGGAGGTAVPPPLIEVSASSVPAIRSPKKPSSSRRPHSPARIGAAAVAALNHKISGGTTTTTTTGNQPTITVSSSSSSSSSSSKLYHKRNMSLPALQLYSRESDKRPLTTVLNFGSWQSYNPHLQKTISQPRVRKHRRSKSASTFGVIDLNLVNHVRHPESDSRMDSNGSAVNTSTASAPSTSASNSSAASTITGATTTTIISAPPPPSSKMAGLPAPPPPMTNKKYEGTSSLSTLVLAKDKNDLKGQKGNHHSSSHRHHSNHSHQHNYDTDSDDQKTCSEPSTHATPMKRPNFVDNLLNS